MDARSVVGQMKKMLAGASVVVALEAVVPSEAQMAQRPAAPSMTPDTGAQALAHGTWSALEPPARPRKTDEVEQRIKEARQRQCNAEWERYHEAQVRPDILGYEPSEFCR